MNLTVADASVASPDPAVDGGAVGGAGSSAEREAVYLRASELAAQLNSAHAELVVLAGGLLRSGWWADGGFTSVAHWLTVRAGMSPARAHDLVLVAQRAEELPHLAAAVHAGTLTLDQAVVIARHCPIGYDESVVALGALTTVRQLRRVMSRYDFGLDPESQSGQATTPEDAPPADPQNLENSVEPSTDPDTATQAEESPAAGPQPPQRSGAGDPGCGGDRPSWTAPVDPRLAAALAPARVSMGYDDLGRFVLSYTAPGDEGALVEAALREAKDALFTAGNPTASYGDAMLEIARRSLDTITSATRRSHYQVHLHLALTDTLTPPPPRGPAPAPASGTWRRGPDGGTPDSGASSTSSRPTEPAPSAPPAQPTAPAAPATSAGAAAPVVGRDSGRRRVVGWIGGHRSLALPLIERYLCNGTPVRPIWHDTRGTPISVGRVQRSIPENTRRVIQDRDHGCAYPGCGNSRFVEIHHVNEWLAHHGPTDEHNLVSLCPTHHTSYHRGQFWGA